MKLNNTIRQQIFHNICERHFGGRIKDYNTATNKFASDYVRDEVAQWEKLAKAHNFPQGTLASRDSTYLKGFEPQEKSYEGTRLFYYHTLTLRLGNFQTDDTGLHFNSGNMIRFSRSVPIGYETEFSVKYRPQLMALAKQADKIGADFVAMRDIVVPMLREAKTTEQLITMWEPIKEHIPTNLSTVTGGLPISVDSAKKLNEILK